MARRLTSGGLYTETDGSYVSTPFAKVGSFCDGTLPTSGSSGTYLFYYFYKDSDGDIDSRLTYGVGGAYTSSNYKTIMRLE